MRTVDLIRKKRDGGELTRDEVAAIVNGYTRGDIPDYQMASFLMAALLKQMTGGELAALTEAMLYSGRVLDFSDLPGAKIDKHSSGGVGDKTSLALAPLAAAGGLYVPMISGRGLGHTGGTLDKLEAIPGFNVNLTLPQFSAVLEKLGCCMIGQTAEIAPADKKIYALRDVTGTVESPYLICASIMSKKLAEGIDGLVLDVKTGSGAFMKSEADSVHLAELMVDTGKRMGKKMLAMITDMDQPLGVLVGNSLEVIECIEIMQGNGPADLRDLCIETAARMFYLGGRIASLAEGRKLSADLIANGKALEKFIAMVSAQGGDATAIERPNRLPHARAKIDVASPRSGYVDSVMCEWIGTASVVLGGGREKKEDSVDPAVGLTIHKKPGDAVKAGEPLVTIHYNAESRLEEARQLITKSYRIEDAAPGARKPLVRRVIGDAAN